MTRKTRNRFLTAFLIIVITGLSVWIDLPKHPHLKLWSLQRDLNIKLGLDLQGGSHLVYRANISGIGDSNINEALAGVRDVIERRVNSFGVSEPLIQTNTVGKEHRVIVDLAGVQDPKEAIKLIGETPQLDFRREVSAEEAQKQFNVDNPKSITGPIFERTDLTGKDLQRASVTFDQTTGRPNVDLEFNSHGTDLFAQLTKQNLGKRIAIYLDSVPISAPTVQSEIDNGRAVISGGFDLNEAKQLAQRLNAGALPVPIELIGQESIGPSLGRRSITESVTAGIIGLIAVMLWMVIFYRLPGLISAIALVLYAIFFISIIKLVPITLTLAGIAGTILTIGMAVDANVLIFERFRENLRHGKTVRYSIEEGFHEAWSSIWASHITSLLSAVVLYSMGTSIIRGFALTFALGTALSLFTAIIITRTFLMLVLQLPITHKGWLLSVRPAVND